MKKAELLYLMQKTRTAFENLLAEIEPEQMLCAGAAGDWSVKDILAHIAWYQMEEAEFFGETGMPASSLWQTPQDERNELLFAQNRSRPLDDVLREFHLAFEKLLSAVENLTDEDLNTPGRFPGTSVAHPPWRAIANHSYEHDREHIEMIWLWMKENSTRPAE